MKTLLACLVSVCVLAGCVSHKASIMYNPKTEDIRECTADPWLYFNPQAVIDDCIEKYEKIGYERVE